jgi:hypothetical protein
LIKLAIDKKFFCETEQKKKKAATENRPYGPSAARLSYFEFLILSWYSPFANAKGLSFIFLSPAALPRFTFRRCAG